MNKHRVRPAEPHGEHGFLVGLVASVLPDGRGSGQQHGGARGACGCGGGAE
jgi:hypothetical protein